MSWSAGRSTLPFPQRPGSRAGAGGARLAGLDATRGAAMFLVCLSHFGDSYVVWSRPDLDRLLRHWTLVATPAFVLTSGLVLGFLYGTHGHDFDPVRRKLVDRALLLLTVARLLIMAAHVPRDGVRVLCTIFITDVLAACVLVGTLAVPLLRPRSRLLGALGLYALGSVLVFSWLPRPDSAAQVLKHLLFGPLGSESSAIAYGFPLVQWLGVYLAGTVVGERLARAGAAGREAWVRRLAAGGAVSIAIGLALHATYDAVARAAGAGAAGLVDFGLSAARKLPPGPVYLLLYLGSALLLVASCLEVERRWPAAAPLRVATLVGRNSLFAFVVQYFLFYSLLYSLHLRFSAGWPLVLLAPLALLVAATHVWQRAGGQALLTVGYPRLIRWVERTAYAHGASMVLRPLA